MLLHSNLGHKIQFTESIYLQTVIISNASNMLCFEELYAQVGLWL